MPILDFEPGSSISTHNERLSGQTGWLVWNNLFHFLSLNFPTWKAGLMFLLTSQPCYRMS